MKLGIDFGTCFSSVAAMSPQGAFSNGILPNDTANKGLPSLFAVYNGKKKFGNACERLLGTWDAVVVKNLKLKMRQSTDGSNPLTEWEKVGPGNNDYMKRIDILKEYITFLLGEALKGINLEGTIENIDRLESVAVTIPVGLDKNATFKSDYTRAIKNAVVEAAKNNGYTAENILVVEEPVAAAMSYLESQRGKADAVKQTIMVLDIGGGTADVAIVECDRNAHTYLPKVTKGDLSLGGNDWDEALKKCVLKKFHAENAEELKMQRYINQLSLYVNTLKHELSGEEESDFELPWYAEPKYITRREFEDATKGLLKRVQDLVISALQAYGGKINNVILVGGACNMPQITRGLESLSQLRGIKIQNFNPSKAIAEGAAYYATCMMTISSGNVNCERMIPVAMATYGLDYTDNKTKKPMVENVIFKGQQFGDREYLEGRSQSYIARDPNVLTINSVIYESECRDVEDERKVVLNSAVTIKRNLHVNGKIVSLTVPNAFIGQADKYHHYYKLRLHRNGDLEILIYEWLDKYSDEWWNLDSPKWTIVDKSRYTVQNEN